MTHSLRHFSGAEKSFWYGCRIAFSWLLLLLLATTMQAQTFPICSTLTDPNNANNTYKVCLTGVTYSTSPLRSTWTYTYETLTGTNISHTVFSAPCADQANEYVTASGCGVSSIDGNKIEYKNPDSFTGVTGLKFDCGNDNGKQTVSFTLNGYYTIGTMSFGIKAGTDGDAYPNAIAGPSCVSTTSAIALNLTAECRVGNTLYWRVTGDDNVNDVPFSWSGAGSGSGVVDANTTYYFTTNTANGNTVTLQWFDPATNTNKTNVKAHSGWTCVYHIIPEKSWSTGQPSGLNGKTILTAESSIATATCGYDANGTWKCTYTRKANNPITSPATPVDLEVPFGETYSVTESPVSGWEPSAGAGNNFCRVDGFEANALPNALTYDLCNNPYSTDIPNELKKFGKHTLVNQPVTNDCSDAVNWLKTYNLITLENLTFVQEVDYNTFVGGNLVNINQLGNQMSPPTFPNYSTRSIEVAGTVQGGNSINQFYSGAFGPSNTLVQLNPPNGNQYTINGRTFNLNNFSQGSTVANDNTLSAKAAQIKIDVEAASTTLATAVANNTLQIQNGNQANFIVNNKDANGIAVFNITDAQVFENSNIAQIEFFNNANATTIIINVAGADINWQYGNMVGNWLTGTNGRSRTLWNFYEATTINFQSRNMMGVVLAPKAALTTQANIEGSTIVRTLNSTAEIHLPYFAGNFSTLCAPTCDLNLTSLSISNCISNNYTFSFGASWTNAPTTGGFQVSINGGAFQNVTRTNFNANGSQTLDIVVPCSTSVYKVEVRFVNSSTCNAVAVFPSNPIDPLGYIYCAGTGELVTGGTITVTPPAGGAAIIFSNGSNGKYDFFTDGTVGDYIISYNPPSGYTQTGTPGVRAGDTDDILNPMIGSEDNPLPGASPLVLGSDATGNFVNDPTLSANPFFFKIRINNGVPGVMNNNIPMNCPCALPPDPPSQCTPPTSFTATITANPGQTVIWNLDKDITNKQYRVTGGGKVIVTGGDLLLNNNAVVYVENSELIIDNGSLSLKKAGARFILLNSTLRTKSNILLDETNTYFCADNSKIELGDEVASSGFTSGTFTSSNSKTGGNFSNTKGITYIRNTCFNVTENFETKVEGKTTLVEVCLELGDAGPNNATGTAFGTKDGDDSGNGFVNSGMFEAYSTQMVAANGGFDNQSGGTMKVCDVAVKANVSGSFNNQGTLTGQNLCIAVNDLIQNTGTWTATIKDWFSKTQNATGNNFSNIAQVVQQSGSEELEANILAMCFESCCGSGSNRTDFGDLPDTYPLATAILGPDANNDGKPESNPSNASQPAIWAGTIVDAEAVPQYSFLANGDDQMQTSNAAGSKDDEDGLTFPAGNLVRGQTYTFFIGTNASDLVNSTTRHYGIWFDWTGDGVFDNFYSGSVSGTGGVTASVLVPVPNNAVNNYATRIVVSSNPVSNTPGGTFNNAEVEDYLNIVPLPIELLDFKATPYRDNQSLLKWSTASEKNNAYFSIQRSRDGRKWQEIGQLKGAGNSQTLLNYDFVDANPLPGVNYYRLQQFDTNGDFSFSPVEVVIFKDKNQNALVYPNPAKDLLYVQLQNATSDEYQLEVFSITGQRLHVSTTATQPGAAYTIDTAPLAPGTYILRISDAQGTTLQLSRFIRQ